MADLCPPGRGTPDGPEPVAIVGMAALFPGAGTVDQYWSNIVGGVDAIRDAPPGRWDDEFYRPEAGPTPPPAGVSRADRLYTRRGGFVDELATFDPTMFGIMPLAVDWAEPDQMLALRLAAEAIADGGGDDRLTDRERVGVVLGRGGYFGPAFARVEQRVKTARQVAVTLREVLPDLPDEALERVHDAFVAKLGPERPEAAIGLVPNLAASRIANRLDLRGPAYTVDAACASSLIAIDNGVRELRLGRADTMIVGGAHIVHEPTFWSTFAMLRALSPSQRIRPFDRAADGVLIGEGVGMVVLRRLTDAVAAGDQIYAVIRGTGIASDGRTSSLMATASTGQSLAVRQAWADAGLDPRAPGAVGLIEAHGTATPNGDAAELATLADVFGAADDAPIGVGSVKSMIGHTMPAAGAAGLIKTALALHHRTLPPTLHLDEPHPAFAGSRLVPILAAAPWAEPVSGAPRRAGVNAFGFGGINAHAVVEQAPDRPAPSPARTFPAAAPAPAPAPAAAAAALVPGAAGLGTPAADAAAEPVLLLAAATPAELLALLAAPDGELLARDDAANPPTGGPCRLALVAPTPRRLALARTVVERGTPWRGRNDLWFTTEGLLTGPAPDGDCAALPVPRQPADGEQQPAGRLAFVFCGLEDKFTPRIDDVCAHFGLPLPDLGETTVLGGHGRASIEVGRVLDEVLRRLGIHPDLVAGHSIGEWNAMISAGLVPGEFVDDFLTGFDPGSIEVPGVIFGAVGCGVDEVADVLAGLPDIVVSHDNCPHQSVLCGREASVTEALARLRARGVLGQVLPFRSGFHSPFLEPYLERDRTSLATTPLREPAVPVWSATTVAPYPRSPAEIRELTFRHLVEPVRFRQLTDRLYAGGVRVFVQVGVGSVAGFVDDTLAGRSQYVTVVSNTPKRSGLDQLRRVVAAIWAEGGAPRFDLLPVRGRALAAGAATAQRLAAPAQPGELAGGPALAGRPAGRGAGRPMLLRLGSPMIRLGPDAPALLGNTRPAAAETTRAAVPANTSVPARTAVPAGVPRPVSAGADHPVLAELELALAETSAVLADVQTGWDTLRTRGLLPAGRSVPGTAFPGARPAPATPSAPRTPPAARPTAPAVAVPAPAPVGPAAPAAPVPGGGAGPVTRTVRRTFSLAEMPHVIDHCFYQQPPGWPDVADRFPVVPMTAELQMMIDEACAFRAAGVGGSGDGAVVIAVRDVRALRWVAIEPPVEVTIACTQLPDGAVRVSIDGYARVTVVFGDAYPKAPETTPVSRDLRPDGTLPGEVPSPHQAAELYGGRWMFHGPSYQGITHVDGIAPHGARGQLVVTDAPGALLDNIGQLYGYWATQYLDVDSLLFPQAVTEMRFYGPDPAVGDRLTCVTRIRDVTAKTVTADLEVRAADGSVWCEVVGWTDRRFTANAWLWLLMRDPERNTVAEPRPDGWVVVPDYWRDIASRELVVRHFLDAERRKVLTGKNPRAAREWLLGRIAGQDAVRRWLWSRGAGPVWGIEVAIGNDDAGRPMVTRLPDRPDIPAGPPPNLSIAHKMDLAVALVDTEGDVGIDLETVAARTEGALAAGLTRAERELLTQLTGAARAESAEAGELARAAWFARLWAAKEAVAKADGTGLQGRPRRFVVDLVVPAGVGAADADKALAAELGLDVGESPAAYDPDQVVMVDGIRTRRSFPIESSLSEPPLLLRVGILPADAAGPDGAAGDQPDTRPSRRRWVALRTVDGMGRVRRESADPVRLGDHVVAWTSPAVERAARARRPREASS